MSTDGPHTKFAFEAGKFLPRFVAKSVTRIMGVRKDGNRPDNIGSALLITLGGRPSFITANHVLTTIEQNDEYKCAGISAVRNGFNSTYLRFEDIDVAIIVPNTEIEVGDECSFWPDELCDREDQDSLMAGDYMLLYGFPGRFSRFNRVVQNRVSVGYPHCTWVRPKRSQAEQPLWRPFAGITGFGPVADVLFEPWQFCLNFAETTGPIKTHEGQTVTDFEVIKDYAGLYIEKPSVPGEQPYGAFGLSGSPVWRFGAKEAGWSLDSWSCESARLVGIVTNWNEHLSVLTATKFDEIAKRFADTA